jgi:hypothetical protein
MTKVVLEQGWSYVILQNIASECRAQTVCEYSTVHPESKAISMKMPFQGSLVMSQESGSDLCISVETVMIMSQSPQGGGASERGMAHEDRNASLCHSFFARFALAPN